MLKQFFNLLGIFVGQMFANVIFIEIVKKFYPYIKYYFGIINIEKFYNIIDVSGNSITSQEKFVYNKTNFTISAIFILTLLVFYYIKTYKSGSSKILLYIVYHFIISFILFYFYF
jgi:hypothetical protein